MEVKPDRQTADPFADPDEAKEVARLRAQLKESDRHKAEFLARLVHDLRNALAPLANALQVWPLVHDDAAELDNLRTIMERQIRQLTHLIDDLSDVANLAGDQFELRTQPVDVSTVVMAVVDALEPFIESCGHRFTTDLPDEPVIVDGDVARLSEIVGSVVQNMAKHTVPRGLLSIVVERRGSQAVISVKDQATPMVARESLSPIVEMFRQVDRALDRSEAGIGVGLTEVKRLAELHGGTVETQSDGLGKGSEIIVSLPAILNAIREQASAPPPAGKVFPADHLPRHRILVVDDVDACATTLALMLRAIGQEVTTARDGLSALQMATEFTPDFAFLDIAMPGIDGYEVARRLRAIPRLKDIRLVALSGFGQEADRHRSLVAGFDHHLTKPANLELIRQLLWARPAI